MKKDTKDSIIAAEFGYVVGLIIGIFVICPIGCSKVQLSPDYKQNAIQTAIVMRDLAEDCNSLSKGECCEALKMSADRWEMLIQAAEAESEVE